MSELAPCVAISLCLYGVVVNSVRYREDGHRDGWVIGDLYLKHQALPAPPLERIRVTVSIFSASDARTLGSLDAPWR